MYHAAENGYLDIVLELRNLGVPWTLYTWYQTLSAAFNMRRRSIVHNMLKDFTTCRQDDYTMEFIYDALPLLMDILRTSKVPVVYSSKNLEILVIWSFINSIWIRFQRAWRSWTA